jgi:hypothetical protein
MEGREVGEGIVSSSKLTSNFASKRENQHHISYRYFGQSMANSLVLRSHELLKMQWMACITEGQSHPQTADTTTDEVRIWLQLPCYPQHEYENAMHLPTHHTKNADARKRQCLHKYQW